MFSQEEMSRVHPCELIGRTSGVLKMAQGEDLGRPLGYNRGILRVEGEPEPMRVIFH
jgi:hypothetical protein